MNAKFKDKCEFIGTDVCNNLYSAFEGLYSKVYRVPGHNDKEYRNMMTSINENKIEVAIVIPEPEVYH